MNQRAPDSSASSTRWLASAMKLLAVLALIIDRQLMVLVAARSRGLIYNRDGKFIYRPARANQGHIIVIDDRQRDSAGAGSPPLERVSGLASATGSSGWPIMDSQAMGSMYRAYSVMNLPGGFYGRAPEILPGHSVSYASTAMPAGANQPHIQLVAFADPRFVATASVQLPALKPAPAYQQPMALLRPSQLARPSSGATHEPAPVLQILQPASTAINYATSARATSYPAAILPQQQFPLPHGQYQPLADSEFFNQQPSNSRLLETQQVELSRTLPSREYTRSTETADLLSPMEEVAPWNEVFEEPVNQRRHPFSSSRLPATSKATFETGPDVQAPPEAATMEELWPSDLPPVASQGSSELSNHSQLEHLDHAHDITAQQLLEKASSSVLLRKLASTNKYHTPEQHSTDGWPQHQFKPRRSHHRHKTMTQDTIPHHLRPPINFNSAAGGNDKNAKYWKKFRHQFEFV